MTRHYVLQLSSAKIDQLKVIDVSHSDLILEEQNTIKVINFFERC